MGQRELFKHTDKGRDGAVWWSGNWECRNKGGYFQDREGGRGGWSYVIYAFGDEDCTVYRLDESGALIHARVPIDANSRLTINGKKYGRRHWRH